MKLFQTAAIPTHENIKAEKSKQQASPGRQSQREGEHFS
jgi:hypothetical protein